MGIKFRCPNGHKLNIKTFLAGKRGVCPDCGSSFRIPTEEAAQQAGKDLLVVPEWKGSKEEDADEALAAASPAVSSRAVGSSVAVGGTQTMAPSAPTRAAAPVNAPVTAPVTAPVPAPVPAAPVVPTSVVDPCAEAPLANWYVRSPAGGQYGPAKGDVMRKWISEGRVSADSLVWREGFPEWRVAIEIFPTLARAGAIGAGVAAAAAVPVPAIPVAPATPEPVPGAAARSLHRYAAKRQNSSFFGLVAFFGLIVLCVGLLIVLAIVLSRTYNEPREKSKEKASAGVTLWQVHA